MEYQRKKIQKNFFVSGDGIQTLCMLGKCSSELYAKLVAALQIHTVTKLSWDI